MLHLKAEAYFRWIFPHQIRRDNRQWIWQNEVSTCSALVKTENT